MSPKRLSRVIQTLREAKGMTQRDLAETAGVTPGYIAQLEMGARKNPSLEVLRRLAKALGVPVTEMLG
jgi:transcriptional regulator with XRE-family HTH domain